MNPCTFHRFRPIPKRMGSFALTSAARQPPKLGCVPAEAILSPFKEDMSIFT